MRRVVLDTNIELSALLFSAGRLTWLRHAWQHQQLLPLICRGTGSELLRVLTYPKFKLSKSEQQELLAGFLPYADAVVVSASLIITAGAAKHLPHLTLRWAKG